METIVTSQHWEPSSGNYRTSLVCDDNGTPTAIRFEYGNTEDPTAPISDANPVTWNDGMQAPITLDGDIADVSNYVEADRIEQDLSWSLGPVVTIVDDDENKVYVRFAPSMSWWRYSIGEMSDMS